MAEEMKNIGKEAEKAARDGFDAAARSMGEMNKGLQAIATEMTDYSRKTLEDSLRAWEQMLGARSVGQVMEIQTQFATRSFDRYMSGMSKLGEMYLSMTRNATEPVERAAKRN
jgi:hypothetical protein